MKRLCCGFEKILLLTFYEKGLLPFEERLRAGAPFWLVPIKNVRKLGPAAGAVPGNQAGETAAKVLGYEICHCIACVGLETT